MMFRKRENLQKPPETFYAIFKDTYPSARIARASNSTDSSPKPFTHSLAGDLSSSSQENTLEDFIEDFPDTPLDQQRNCTLICTDVQDHDRTPRASHHSWISIPPDFHLEPLESVMPAFQLLESQEPTAIWALSPCETGTSFEYVPEPEMEMEPSPRTPHSLFDSEPRARVDWMENIHSLCSQPRIIDYHPSFISNERPHQLPDFDYITRPGLGNQVEDGHKITEIQPISPIMDLPFPSDGVSTTPLDSVVLQRLRFRVKLNAPTAMTEGASEIPVTYLNKGQIYLMSISDTTPPKLGSTLVQYRTSIRISFDSEGQKQKRDSHWQLWRDGRGGKEANQRGGKLQGVEYVEVQQATNYSGRVEFEASSVDGFSVLWSQESCNSSDCHVAVRFNFLSTDFSYAKGVRGISCRLCVKTVIVFPDSPEIAIGSPEVSFCKVKLFRDHGAERKRMNDVAHINKSITKIREQISKIDVNMVCSQNGPDRLLIATSNSQRTILDNYQNHKRVRSSSTKCIAEEELYSKLSMLQAKLLSARPVSILNIRGREQDDPDRQATLLIDDLLDTAQVEQEEAIDRQQRRNGYTPIATPRYEIPSLDQRVGLHPVPPIRTVQTELSNPQHLASPPIEHMEFERTNCNDSRTLSRVAKTLQDEFSSRCAALSRQLNPVACFYTLYPNYSPSTSTHKNPNNSRQKHYYQAIYLFERKANALATSIAGKYDFFSPARSIVRMTHISATKPGIEIAVDDDFVRELREGQDMLLEWERQGGGGGGVDEGYVLRLIF